jgi:hypothetical protein
MRRAPPLVPRPAHRHPLMGAAQIYGDELIATSGHDRGGYTIDIAKVDDTIDSAQARHPLYRDAHPAIAQTLDSRCCLRIIGEED